jgi:hypothetical protein
MPIDHGLAAIRLRVPFVVPGIHRVVVLGAFKLLAGEFFRLLGARGVEDDFAEDRVDVRDMVPCDSERRGKK